MAEAKFELCTCCGKNGWVVRPSGLSYPTIYNKHAARQQLNEMWHAGQVNAAVYTSVRNVIEGCPLPDGGPGTMQPDDPIIGIMNGAEPDDTFEDETFTMEHLSADAGPTYPPPEDPPPRDRFN